jgi:hypothetical protein
MKRYFLFIAVLTLFAFACTKNDKSKILVPIQDNIKLKTFYGEKVGVGALAQFVWTDSFNNRWNVKVTSVDTAGTIVYNSVKETTPASDTVRNLLLNKKYQVDVQGTRRINSTATFYNDRLRFYFFIGTMGDVQISY